MDVINNIGDDLLKLTLSYLLKFQDIENARVVCKTWLRIVKEMHFTLPRYSKMRDMILYGDVFSIICSNSKLRKLAQSSVFGKRIIYLRNHPEEIRLLQYNDYDLILLYQEAGNRTYFNPNHLINPKNAPIANTPNNLNKQEIIRGIYFGIYSGILFCASTLFSNSTLFNLSATAIISFCQGGAQGVRRFSRVMSYKTIPKERFFLFSSFCVYFPFVWMFGNLSLMKGIELIIVSKNEGLICHGPIYSGLCFLGALVSILNPGMWLYMPLLGALEKYDE